MKSLGRFYCMLSEADLRVKQLLYCDSFATGSVHISFLDNLFIRKSIAGRNNVSNQALSNTILTYKVSKWE